MKKATGYLLLVIFCVGLGCATVKVEAPPKTKIVLLGEFEGSDYVIKKRVFYALWGLVPLTPNSTAEMLPAGTEIEAIKVKTYYDVVDFLISYVLGSLTIHSRTVEIEVKKKAE